MFLLCSINYPVKGCGLYADYQRIFLIVLIVSFFGNSNMAIFVNASHKLPNYIVGNYFMRGYHLQKMNALQCLTTAQGNIHLTKSKGL